MKTSNPKLFDYSFKILLLVLFGALIVFSLQWYEAWIQVQEAQQHITLD